MLGLPWGVDAWSASRPDAVDMLITRFVEDNGLPGASVAFGLPGHEPELRAYGLADEAGGVPMSIEDRLKIASLSKPITAAAVIELARRQGSSLDAPLLGQLSLARGAADSRVAAITLGHLMRHGGGWDHAETFDPLFLREEEVPGLIGAGSDLSDCGPLATAWLDRDLQFAPGERYAYSNIGYCLLGLVLAESADGSYEEAVHGLLPETAAMSLDAATVTHAVRPEDQGLLVNRPEVVAAAGGWIASAGDYFRFAARDIPPETFDRPAYASGVQHYGLGWRVWELDGRTVLTHFGSMPGAYGIVVRVMDGPIFVALFNGRPSDGEVAFDTLFAGILGRGDALAPP